ncbi:hypothetical protein PR003_g33069 [Phytophthora rubi]|uniref:Uncharacterized protein n=1 Tax=Phytophthora rubi TaxID=129364 RepID=A0A6A4AVY8_9STRA|nr:hypothetical protein PR003_g33069 [Phytophthora rubi]
MESPRPPKKRKTQVRFDDADDDALLKEILAVNPFQVERGSKTAAWATVAAALVLDVDARRCRERSTLLLTEFKAKMAKSAAASGIEEEHTERDDLLANVLELSEDAEALRDEKKQEKEAKQQDNERADAMREEAMNGMGKRKNKYDSFTELMTHVKERDEFSRALDLRKVANEEKRLALERDRLSLEKEERMAFIDVLRAFTSRLPQ